MHHHNLFVFLFVVLFAISGYAVEIHPAPPDHPLAAQVTTNNYLFFQSSGFLDLSFTNALDIFKQDQLLEAVQAAYAAQLPEGEEPEFVISQSTSNTYSYVNKEKETSVITELFRRQTDPQNFVIAYYAKGDRYFGAFQALIHIQATETTDGLIDWKADIYAYPENALCRFVIRHIGPVKGYFRRKTKSISKLAVSICYELCKMKPDKESMINHKLSQIEN